jgi:hypothetical protein
LFVLQSIYSVPEELEDEADRVFEKYAHNQCKNMMYQARPDAVKFYYREIIKRPKSDAFACAKLLTFEEYMQCKLDWFTDECWESLCEYWCSDEYLKKRRVGQASRKKIPDGAQNRGGSRPLVETRVRKTGGNRSGSTGSRWNRSGPVHEPVRFPPQNRAYEFTSAVNRPV